MSVRIALAVAIWGALSALPQSAVSAKRWSWLQIEPDAADGWSVRRGMADVVWNRARFHADLKEDASLPSFVLDGRSSNDALMVTV